MAQVLIFVFKASGNELGLEILVQKDENDKCVEVRNTLDKLFWTRCSKLRRLPESFGISIVDGKNLGRDSTAIFIFDPSNRVP